MNVERIMLECRYLLSLNKNYQELSNIFEIGEDIVWDDLNNKLKNIDISLYNRCQKKLKNINNLEKIGNTIIG